jgi:hypothetical protein
MKKGICEKCGKEHWLQEHHVPPKGSKIPNQITYSLCPNCHVDFHQYLGMKNIKNDSIKYHHLMFYRWLLGLGVATIILYLTAF